MVLLVVTFGGVFEVVVAGEMPVVVVVVDRVVVDVDEWSVDKCVEVGGDVKNGGDDVSGASDFEEWSLGDSSEAGGDTVSVCVDIGSGDSDADE